jgi:hypothetical protein
MSRIQIRSQIRIRIRNLKNGSKNSDPYQNITDPADYRSAFITNWATIFVEPEIKRFGPVLKATIYNGFIFS